MKSTERNALVKIVKSRFAQLKKELIAREGDIRTIIYKRIVSENKATVERFTKRAKAIEAKAEKLREEHKALVAEAHAAGIVVGSVTKRTGWVDTDGYLHGDGYHTPDRAKQHAIPLYDTSETYSDNLFKLEVATRFAPRNIAEAINREVGKLKDEKNAGLLALDRLEQSLTEEVLLDTLDSPDAQEFLKRVPTVDSLIALPEGATAKQLRA